MTVTGDQHDGHPLGATDPQSGPPTARETVNAMVEAGLLDQVMARADAGELALTGKGVSSRR